MLKKIVIILMGIAAVTGCTPPCTSSCEVNTQEISYNAFAVGLNNDGSICVPGGAIPAK